MGDGLIAFMRWLHFTSIATLVGGMIYARLVMAPSLRSLAPDAQDPFDAKAAAGYRPLVIFSVLGLIVSGTFNLLTKPGHSLLYHVLLGVKLMLVLHVFAVAFLVTQPKNPRRARMMTGVVISGLVILAISAYLGRIV